MRGSRASSCHSPVGDTIVGNGTMSRKEPAAWCLMEYEGKHATIAFGLLIDYTLCMIIQKSYHDHLHVYKGALNRTHLQRQTK